jgi:hypothetical protein
MPMKAQRGGGSIAPTHCQPSTRKRWVISTMLQLLYTWERSRLDGTGVQSPNHTACNKPPYKLCHPGQFNY